jgi:hypothetical protein
VDRNLLLALELPSHSTQLGSLGERSNGSRWQNRKVQLLLLLLQTCNHRCGSAVIRSLKGLSLHKSQPVTAKFFVRILFDKETREKIIRSLAVPIRQNIKALPPTSQPHCELWETTSWLLVLRHWRKRKPASTVSGSETESNN